MRGECDRRSVRHHHRELGVREDVSRDASEYELAQPAAGVGALDHQVGPDALRGFEQGLSGALPARFHGAAFGADAAAHEVGDRVLRARPRHLRSRHRDH